MKKKVFIGSSVHPWNDPRILHKQAVSLSRYFNVELHIPAPFTHKIYKNVHIHGMPEWLNKSQRFKIILILLFRIIKSRARIVHLHDPELLPVGIIVKLITSKKVIFDFHEEYAQTIPRKEWIPKAIRRIILFIYLQFEQVSCKVFDGVIGVLDVQLPVLSKHTKAVIIKNYPDINSLSQLADHQLENKGVVQLVYIGDITKERRIDQWIKVVGNLNDCSNVMLHLIGKVKDKKYLDLIQGIIKHDHLQNHVKLYGRLIFEEAWKFASKCDIGLLPPRHPKDIVRCLPVKLFEYMAVGLPVIMAKEPIAMDIVESTQCGVFIDSLSLDDMTEKTKYLIENNKVRAQMGENGMTSVRSDYSWRSQEIKLINFYFNVIKL